MQHKSHKLLYLFAFFIILLAGLLIAAGPANALPEEPYPVEVRFADKTTLDQVDTLLTPLQPEVISPFRWQVSFGAQAMSGGLEHALGTDPHIALNAHWRAYIPLVTSMMPTIQVFMDTSLRDKGHIPPNLQRQHNDYAAEIQRINTQIANCWETNACPPVLIKRVTLMATQSTVRQLVSSTLVDQVDPVMPPTAFFLLKALGFLPQN